MVKLTKQSFQYFKGVYELPCGWCVEDQYYEEVIQPELDKMKWAKYRAEFMFKCLYPGERPLSKEDYKRTRYTHMKICDKLSTLYQVETKSQKEARGRGMRKLKIQKGLYPFGIRFDEAIEKYPEIKKYYEEGTCKQGSFVHKFIMPIHRF